MIYIDTNVLVRLITNDVPSLAEAAFELIEAHRGQKIHISEAVLVEVCFILQYHEPYFMKHEEIAAQLRVFLKDAAFSTTADTLTALELFGKHSKLDFVDCLLLSKSGGQKGRVLTFDKALLAALK
ncbi:MAG: PIN domain-containing protein [Candidatus Saccharimonadales bacterium]